MKRILFAEAFTAAVFFALACAPNAVSQLGVVADDIATEILNKGCEANSNQAQMLSLSTKALRKWEGEPNPPLPVDTKDPDDGDVAIVKIASQEVVNAARAREWIKLALLSVFGVASAGGLALKRKGIVGMIGRVLGGGGGGGKGGDGWASTLVAVVDKLKGLVAPGKEDKVGEVVRNVTRKHGKVVEVQEEFEKVHHPNGGVSGSGSASGSTTT